MNFHHGWKLLLWVVMLVTLFWDPLHMPIMVLYCVQPYMLFARCCQLLNTTLGNLILGLMPVKRSSYLSAMLFTGALALPFLSEVHWLYFQHDRSWSFIRTTCHRLWYRRANDVYHRTNTLVAKLTKPVHLHDIEYLSTTVPLFMVPHYGTCLHQTLQRLMLVGGNVYIRWRVCLIGHTVDYCQWFILTVASRHR